MRRIGFFAALLSAGALAAAAAHPGVFRDVTKSSGIDMRVKSDLMRLKLIATMGGGCAAGDFDGDGRVDLYVTNSTARWGKPNTKDCGRLYRNVGGGRFEDVTEKSGIRACGLGMGAFWADLDGDGRLDLYLTNVGPNAVWWNKGDGTFEPGRDTGLEDPGFSVGAAFVDYDGDGRLDVAVANYLDSTPEWEASQPQLELRVPEDYTGQQSHLFRNAGNRRFVDVTKEAGLVVPPAETKTLGIAVLDYDGDGRPDLYFVNDRVGNRLFHNKGGAFEETTDEAGAGALGAQPRAGMGVAVGDPFGDLRESLFVTNFGAEPNSLYRNLGGGVFDEVGKASGAADVGMPFVRWGTHFADFDDDGWPDLYAAGGHLAPRVVRDVGHYRKGRNASYVDAGERAFAQRTVLLRNLGGGRFAEWTDSGDLAGLRMSARGTAVFDVDGDGDLDLVVVPIDGRVRVLENTLGGPKGPNGWIAVEPRPSPGGGTVIETRVRVKAGERVQEQVYRVSPSYASGSLVPLHFGLGAARRADQVEVRWPDGKTQIFRDVEGEKVYRIRPGGALE